MTSYRPRSGGANAKIQDQRLPPSVRLVPCIALLHFLLANAQTAATPPANVLVNAAALSTSSFNPASAETVDLRYRLPRDATVTVSIYDPDRRLIRILAANAKRKQGDNKERWDGKDLDGRIVPDEAYFFVIEAKDEDGNTAVYDPITFSGGEFGDVTVGQVDKGSGTVTYELSRPSRVLLRAGIAGSVMLKTVVDWEPRAAGTVTEYWNGKDEDGVIDLFARKHTLVLSYTTLPETNVITYGNSQYNYRQYRASLKAERPMKADRPMANHRRISPHFLQSRLTDRAFKVKIDFPQLRKGEAVKDRVLVRLDIDPKDRAILGDQQLEVMLFVDTEFHTEEERGYLPMNIPLELQQLPPGEHVITVNVVTLGDQIGVGSRKIQVGR
ncbi:MAG TPA: FlgD immunoglobulin-like domain containing protein [Thermoanaerobaculia bacterium]|nr:FlgD immunoglobulin-like domain containing protein [Thermoanaerobaculia bacterium]